MTDTYKKGLVVQPSPGAVPRLKSYLDEKRGGPLGDVWSDIPPINSQAAERLGYSTKKNGQLLERIIKLSSNPGDVVLDPICGCGTTVAVAQKHGRSWIGIDITHLAISLIKKRLFDSYGEEVKYKVIGEPVSLQDPTKSMWQEALEAGFLRSETWNLKYPKIQILMVKELLERKQIDMPPRRYIDTTFQKAPSSRGRGGAQNYPSGERCHSIFVHIWLRTCEA